MKIKGIEIKVVQDENVFFVRLEDILNEIKDGEDFDWSLLFFYGSGHLADGKTIPNFIEEVNHSERGIFIDWEDLNALATRFDQVIDLLIIGSKTKDKIGRYKNDQDMYESCDFSIELIDGGFWIIFSYDLNFIDKLSKKFIKTKLLDSNFQDEWLKKDSS